MYCDCFYHSLVETMHLLHKEVISYIFINMYKLYIVSIIFPVLNKFLGKCIETLIKEMYLLITKIVSCMYNDC